MPYRGMTALTSRITEGCVRDWAQELNPHSRNYLYYFLKYLDWAKVKGYWASAEEMLDDHAKHAKAADQREQYKHLDVLSMYVRGKGTGSNDRRQTYHAFSNFYSYHRRPLPALPRNEAEKLFKPSEQDAKRAVQLQPLQPEEVRQLVLHAPMPYKAVFAVMFQGTLGLAEFMQFNANWERIAGELDKPGPSSIIGVVS
jgi:hypothetical protein